MKLLIICDKLDTDAMKKCVADYIGQIHPDAVCFAPSYQQSPQPKEFTTLTELIGSGHRYDGIWFLGHGNVDVVGNLDSKSIATVVNTMKSKTGGCTVTLVACGTADENQLLLNQNGASGFKAGTLVTNVAKQLTSADHVIGATVPVPMDPHAPLPSNPAQGQVVKKSGGGH